MVFEITKEELLQPLQIVSGVVDKKQLQPILSCVLLVFDDNELIVTATDLDIELIVKTEIKPQDSLGKLVLPARKLLDICKSLPDKSVIKLSETDNQQVTLISNRSRFTLSSLNHNEFPTRQEIATGFSFNIPQSNLKHMLSYTNFAIAQQDVRHYLMGMLWEFTKHQFKVVATDGHRLATTSYKDKTIFPNYPIKIIMPRKGVNELTRLLDEEDRELSIRIADNSIQIEVDNVKFTSKLIDSQFPDYNRVFPSHDNSSFVKIEKEVLKDILNRVSILSNDKHKAIRLNFSTNQLIILANNQEQEQAEELIEISYSLDPLDLCINYSYLMDVLQKIPTNSVKIQLKQSNTPILITPVLDSNIYTDDTSEQDSNNNEVVVEPHDSDNSNNSKRAEHILTHGCEDIAYVIMPMCL